MKYVIVTNSIYEGHPQEFYMGPFFVGMCETLEEVRSLIEENFKEHTDYLRSFYPNTEYTLDWSNFERSIEVWGDPSHVWVELNHTDKHPRSTGYIIFNTEAY